MNKIIAVIVGLIVIGFAGSSILIAQQNKQVDKSDGSALPAYGESLVSDQPGGNSDVLAQISGQTSGPSQAELQKYEQYKTSKQILSGDIKVGDGDQAVVGKTIAVGYTGYLTSGQIFDKTTDKAFALKIGDHKVIPGFEQGVLGMKVGGKRRVIIPPALGYGAQAQGQIPANSLLVFDIELLAVK